MSGNFSVRILLFIAVLFSLFFGPAAGSKAAAKGLEPDDIIRMADAVRCPSESYFMEVEVVSQGQNDNVRLEVYTKGREKTRVNTIAPARDKGRNMVMIGEDMWAYVPNLKRAVRVALNQKLTGQAANGDVSRMRWWGDYTATRESEDAKVWTLMLTARKKGLTYEKMRVWVEKASFKPLTAEYLSQGGKVLKRSQFREYKKIAGAVRPTEIHIQDAGNAEDSSVIRILKLEPKNSSDAIFNHNALK
jgi:outer membrane lipoprotein-sorting protein